LSAWNSEAATACPKGNLRSASKIYPKILDFDPDATPEAAFSPDTLHMDMFSHLPVEGTVRRYLVRAKAPRPVYLIIANHIVGLAARTPVPNRGPDADTSIALL
jgi:hypothetical protein